MVEPDPKRSDLEILYRQAENGDPIAQRNLAGRLNNGDGVPQDRAAAILWLRRQRKEAIPGHKPNTPSSSDRPANQKISAKAWNG
jgi:TPR repeat protein